MSTWELVLENYLLLDVRKSILMFLHRFSEQARVRCSNSGEAEWKAKSGSAIYTI